MTTATVNRPAGTQPPEPTTRADRRRRRRLLVALVIALALLGASGWLVYGSSTFSTDMVTVHGGRQVSDGQVGEVAQVPLGLPLARQDVDAIARRSTTLPAVRSATVERRWPHTVVITVVERQPLLAVRQPGGYFIVDKEGVAYQSSPTLPRGAVIADVNPDAVDVLTQVGAVAAGMPDQFRGKVSSIGAMNANGIEVKLVSGLVVRWGTSADSPLKSQIVLALLKQKPKVSIDVTSPHNPAIR